jgi:hypothetical protein
MGDTFKEYSGEVGSFTLYHSQLGASYHYEKAELLQAR